MEIQQLKNPILEALFCTLSPLQWMQGGGKNEKVLWMTDASGYPLLSTRQKAQTYKNYVKHL